MFVKQSSTGYPNCLAGVKETFSAGLEI